MGDRVLGESEFTDLKNSEVKGEKVGKYSQNLLVENSKIKGDYALANAVNPVIVNSKIEGENALSNAYRPVMINSEIDCDVENFSAKEPIYVNMPDRRDLTDQSEDPLMYQTAKGNENTNIDTVMNLARDSDNPYRGVIKSQIGPEFREGDYNSV